MNPLHLLWIVPLAASFGFAASAVLSAAAREDTSSDSKTELT